MPRQGEEGERVTTHQLSRGNTWAAKDGHARKGTAPQNKTPRHTHHRNSPAEAHGCHGHHTHTHTRPPAPKTGGRKRARGGAEGQERGSHHHLAQRHSTHHTAAQPHGYRGTTGTTPTPTPSRRPEGWAAARGREPNGRRPQQQREKPPQAAPCNPCGARHREGHASQRAIVPGPHARTPTPTTIGQRTQAACPKDGQPGEGERLT